MASTASYHRKSYMVSVLGMERATFSELTVSYCTSENGSLHLSHYGRLDALSLGLLPIHCCLFENRFVPYVGWAAVIMIENPSIKYLLIGCIVWWTITLMDKM